MLTLSPHWKICTSLKLVFYGTVPGSPRHMQLFNKSYYTRPDPNNNFGYGKIVKPRTEHVMHQDCINVMRELNWKLVAQEWCVSPGYNHHGQGDLVFQFQHIPTVYMVIEVKRRNSKYVYKQSEFYAQMWKQRFVQHEHALIYYGVWTSYKQEIIGKK